MACGKMFIVVRTVVVSWACFCMVPVSIVYNRTGSILQFLLLWSNTLEAEIFGGSDWSCFVDERRAQVRTVPVAPSQQQHCRPLILCRWILLSVRDIYRPLVKSSRTVGICILIVDLQYSPVCAEVGAARSRSAHRTICTHSLSVDLYRPSCSYVPTSPCARPLPEAANFLRIGTKILNSLS